MTKKHTTEEFISLSIKKHGDIYDYSKVVYEGQFSPIIIICKEHGEFRQLAKNHLAGNGCQQCGIAKSAQSTKLKIEDYFHSVNYIHKNKYKYDQTTFTNVRNKISVCCPVHGWFDINAMAHKKGQGCKVCGRVSGELTRSKKRSSSGDNLANEFPLLIAEWDYDKNIVGPNTVAPKSANLAWWKCKRGHSYKARVANRTSESTQSGCPICAKHSSKLEIYLFCYLKILGFSATWRERIEKLEVDIVIQEKSICIEVDGYPWHTGEKSKKRDTLKARKLNKLGFDVIRLRDTRNGPIEGNVVYYTEEIANFRRHASESLLKKIDEKHSRLSGIQKKAFLNLYHEYLERYPGVDYEKSIASIVPEIETYWGLNNPVSPDTVSFGSKEKYDINCKNCGQVFKRVAQKLSANKSLSCNTCAKKVRIEKLKLFKNSRLSPLNEKVPEIVMFWGGKNTNLPSELVYSSKSEEVVHINCTHCSQSFERKVRALKSVANLRCRSCSNRQNRHKRPTY